MKIITCANARNYNLTVGENYTTLQDDDNAEIYLIRNDIGLERNYHSSLFRDEEEERVTPPQAEVAEAAPIVPDTDEEIIATINVEEQVVSFTIDGERYRYDFDGYLSESSTEISCGIRQMSNINGITRNIVDSVPHRPGLSKAILKALITNFIAMDMEDCAIVIASTNTNADNFDLLASVLDEMSETTLDRLNPNSDNDIRLWTIVKDDI